VVARALAKRPADRFETAGELGAAALAAARVPGATARTRRLRRSFGGSPAAARPTARLAAPRRRLLPIAALVAVLAGVVLAAALGVFSGDDAKAPAPKAQRPAPPPAPPAASPVGGTVSCSETACAQRGVKVVPPIEGAPCTPGGHAGEWQRIDADGEEPLFGCVPSDAPPQPALAAVPDLTGARLDHAERMLSRFGVDHDTSGGGTFGIIDSGNWTVCTTTPVAGAALTPDSSVKLFVERSC